ncbi:unnamed protein product [Peniophora sp. CBMAI 1063]|nr:unnamed protein product [Peniophora sp. CBMAI 1063]
MPPAHSLLVVPKLFSHYIPANDLSAADLLLFELPAFAPQNHAQLELSTDSPTAFSDEITTLTDILNHAQLELSTDSPTAFSDEITTLTDILVPPRDVVLKLRGQLRHLLNTPGLLYRSIRASTSFQQPVLVPLWTVTFWFDIFDAMIFVPKLRDAMIYSRVHTSRNVPVYLSHVVVGLEHFWTTIGWNVPLPCGPTHLNGSHTTIHMCDLFDLFADRDMDGKLVEAVIHLFRGWIAMHHLQCQA